MKNTNRLDRPLVILAALTLVGTLIQALLLLFSYDPTLSLYNRGTPSYLVVALILLIPILSAALSFTLPGGKLSFAKKRTFDNPESDGSSAAPVDPESILVKIGALFLVMGAVLFGFLLFYGNFIGDYARELWQSVANGSADSTVKLAGDLIRFSAYIGSLAAVYPALLLIIGKGRPITALVTVIWLLLLDMSNYCYNGSVINDPCRLLEIVGLSAAILWMLIEIRRMQGRADRRTYTFLSFSAFAVLCISAIPRLIATAAGRLNFTSVTMIPLALFGIATMIAGRLYGLRTVSATAEPGSEPAPEEAEGTEEDTGSDPEALTGTDSRVITIEDAALPLDTFEPDDADLPDEPDEPDVIDEADDLPSDEIGREGDSGKAEDE